MQKYFLLIVILFLTLHVELSAQGAKSQKPGSIGKDGNERVNTEESDKETILMDEENIENFSSTIFIDTKEVDKVELHEYFFEGVYPIIRGIPNEDLEKEIN